MFSKKKRVVNKKLLATYRVMSCCACGGNNQVAAHHLKTVGSGGDDVVSNLIPLCFRCHELIHHIGEYAMRIKYPELDKFIIVTQDD